MPDTNTVFSRRTPRSGNEHLQGGQDRVVATARAPPDLLVRGPVLAGRRPGSVVSVISWPRLFVARWSPRCRPRACSRTSSSISAARNGDSLDLATACGRRPGSRPAPAWRAGPGWPRGRAPGRRRAATSPRFDGKGFRCTSWAWATLSPRARTRRTPAAMAPKVEPHPSTSTGAAPTPSGSSTSNRGMSVGDAGHLGGPQVDHPLVVDRVVGDVARAVLLLEAADAVLEPGRPGHGPGAGQRLLVAHVGPERRRAVLVGVVGARWRSRRRSRAAWPHRGGARARRRWRGTRRRGRSPASGRSRR